jgi:hypothetical protein
MQAALQRIEALPGDGRYAVTFRRGDGSEQTAVVHLDEDRVDVAEASLPTGWTTESPEFVSVRTAVAAFDAARRQSSGTSSLRDLPGGWDVSLGNVVLDDARVPSCTAHGEMAADGDVYVCAECGARALYGAL